MATAKDLYPSVTLDDALQAARAIGIDMIDMQRLCAEWNCDPDGLTDKNVVVQALLTEIFYRLEEQTPPAALGDFPEFVGRFYRAASANERGWRVAAG